MSALFVGYLRSYHSTGWRTCSWRSASWSCRWAKRRWAFTRRFVGAASPGACTSSRSWPGATTICARARRARRRSRRSASWTRAAWTSWTSTPTSCLWWRSMRSWRCWRRRRARLTSTGRRAAASLVIWFASFSLLFFFFFFFFFGSHYFQLAQSPDIYTWYLSGTWNQTFSGIFFNKRMILWGSELYFWCVCLSVCLWYFHKLT